MDVDALRAEVAKRHNVLLDKADPIFITVALNELVLEHYLGRMHSIANDARDEASAAVSHQVEVAKEAAAKLVTQSAGYIAEQVKNHVNATTAAAQKAASESAADSIRASRTALYAAGATLFMSGAVLVLALVELVKH